MEELSHKGAIGMKFENNNNEVIKKITSRSLKKNKVRNIFAIIAIILTTFMIASVFSLGISIYENNNLKELRLKGYNSDISLKNPTEEQVEKLKGIDKINSVGYEIPVGKAQLEDKKVVCIEYFNDTFFRDQMMPAISDIEGEYPSKENEAMLSRRTLQLLGIDNYKIGDKITISYNLKNKQKESVFILKGLYTDYSYENKTGNLLVSKEFIDNNSLTLEKDGVLFMTVGSDYKNSIEQDLNQEVKLNEGQEFINSNKHMSSDDTEAMIILVAIAVIFIMLSGYLLIYNVMYISVTKDINFYGLLKTIGTSPRQIKKIVKGQISKLSIIGIPTGLIIGSLVSLKVIPWAIKSFFDGAGSDAMPSDVSFNPLIFTGTALFAYFTIIISCRKPAKIASSISPTEALRYTGVKSKKKKKFRKSSNGGKLYKMAWYNVFRDKKRVVIVILSLFMGVMTFLGANTFVESMSVDNYIKHYLKYDFRLESSYLKEGLSNNEIKDIESIEGIKEITLYKTANVEFDPNDDVFLPTIKYDVGNEQKDIDAFFSLVKEDPKSYSSWVIGIDDKVIEKYNESTSKKIDINEFKKGNIALVEPFLHNDEDSNKFDELQDKKLSLKGKDLQSVFDIKLVEDKGDFLPYPKVRKIGIPAIYISNSALEKLDKEAKPSTICIDVDKNYESEINNKLESMSKINNFDLIAKSTRIEGLKKAKLTMNAMSGAISLILILIGAMNFINVMITGVNARLNELAVIESIGMTKKQIKKMLTFEGAYYAAIITVLISTVGIGIMYLISMLTKQIMDYAKFNFPLISLTIVIVLMFTICMVTPTIVYKINSKQSITERLRKTEN